MQERCSPWITQLAQSACLQVAAGEAPASAGSTRHSRHFLRVAKGVVEHHFLPPTRLASAVSVHLLESYL